MNIYGEIQKRLASAMLCGTLAVLPLRVMAQDATEEAGGAGATATQAKDTEGKDKAPDAPRIIEPTVNAGEIRVDGKVTAIIGGALMTIDVVSFTTAAGKTVELSEAKPKSIQLRADTDYRERADATKKLAFEDLKLGRRISVIGKDQGSGKALPAREIVLWPERDANTKTLGVVRVNAETAKLMTRGQDALQARDAATALRFFQRAADAAQVQRDVTGQALSLDWAGSALSELEQPDEALKSYNSAIGFWHQAGDSVSEALSLNNIAMVYGRQKEGAKAVDALERATQLLANGGSKKQFVLTWSNLANAYMSVKEKEKAISALTQVLPLVRGQNDKSEEASTLGDLAYLYAATGQKEKAQTFLDQVAPLLDMVEEKGTLASTLDSLGLAYNYLDQTEKSLEFYRRALTAFTEAGDKPRAENTQRNINRIEKGGETDIETEEVETRPGDTQTPEE